MKISPFARFVSALAASTTVVAIASPAHAQSDVRGATPLGTKGTLVIDDLSGFRASSVGGVSYAGLIGVNTQALSVDLPTATPGVTNGTATVHSTSVWFAPSFDYFVINHLSIGGVLEIAHTSSSFTDTEDNVSKTTTNPGVTSFTILPRVGWMFGITDRFGIWPRLGLGFTDRTNAAVAAFPGATDTFSAFVVDLDVGFVYRINQTFFLTGRPELTFAPGSVSNTEGNVTTSVGASLFQFALTGGVGIMWDL